MLDLQPPRPFRSLRPSHGAGAGGFALLELIAVLIVLSILAGVAVPRYFDFSEQRKAASARAMLEAVRAGIENFQSNAGLGGAAVVPTADQLVTTGTVMREPIPPNPYNQSSEVRPADGEFDPALAGQPVQGAAGWAYDSTVGAFWSNSALGGSNRW